MGYGTLKMPNLVKNEVQGLFYDYYSLLLILKFLLSVE